MKSYQINHMRMTVEDENGQTIVTHQQMAEFGSDVMKAMARSLDHGPVALIGREVLVVKPSGVGTTEMSLIGYRFGDDVSFNHYLAEARRLVEARENEMMLEAMGVSMKQKKNRDQQHDKGAKRVADSPPPGRFSGPHGMTGPGPIQSPRNMMLITEQSPEKPPMTRAERRRAEKIKRKP